MLDHKQIFRIIFFTKRMINPLKFYTTGHFIILNVYQNINYFQQRNAWYLPIVFQLVMSMDYYLELKLSEIKIFKNVPKKKCQNDYKITY